MDSSLSGSGRTSGRSGWEAEKSSPARDKHLEGESFQVFASVCRKSGPATFSTEAQPAARRIRPLQADKSHTRGPQSIFSDAHVAGENEFHLIRAIRRKLREAFSTSSNKHLEGFSLQVFACYWIERRAWAMGTSANPSSVRYTVEVKPQASARAKA